MFVYLWKKVAVPKGGQLQCLTWNSEEGWISVGGGGGLLKVMKLESARSGEKKQAKSPPKQSLEGHSGNVGVAIWNEHYQKLTTSDTNGLIIVWMRQNGQWYEEMINNREGSQVKDMRWTADGQKICIGYSDGSVIVGTVDGNRLWAKDLDLDIAFTEWSPDQRTILFATNDGRVYIYDGTGSRMGNLPIYAVPEESGIKIVGLEWYKNRPRYNTHIPSLAVCFQNGRAQIMRNDHDDNPVLIDTGMAATSIKWNNNGTVLAIAGSMTKTSSATVSSPTTSPTSPSEDIPRTHHVQFYSPMGKHLRTLNVPGKGINALAWDGDGLRVAMAVDGNLFFANVRPDYGWAYFANTLVYTFTKPNRSEDCLAFWDMESGECHVKYVKQLVGMGSGGDNCVLATEGDEKGKYILILCNAIGSPVDSKHIEVEPLSVSMSATHIIVASEQVVYFWNYKSGKKGNRTGSSSGSSGTGDQKDNIKEFSFHVDTPFPESSSSASSALTPSLSGSSHDIKAALSRRQKTSDPIVALTTSETDLLIGRASGTLLRFGWTSQGEIFLKNKYLVKCLPHRLALNCTSSRLSIIDINGTLTLFDLDAKPNTSSTGDTKSGPGSSTSSSSSSSSSGSGVGAVGKHLDFERRDVWDMKWSNENPELLACMEKQRMYVFRGLQPEEPKDSHAYLCQFSDLEIKAVLLDDVMGRPEEPSRDFVLNFETKSLRDSRQLLATVPIKEAFQFIEDNPHPRLWRLLAETALEQLNFLVADKAFVRCSDYQGIQFVKKLKVLNDRKKQRAEVCAYFKRFEEAERLYLEMDTPELAVELRSRLGDWPRVLELIQGRGDSHGLEATDDKLLSTAWNHLGDYHAARHNWAKAYEYYSKSKNVKAQIHCAYRLDDYTALTSIIDLLPESDEALQDMGEKFMSVGLCNEAVKAFLKRGDSKAAINCCVHLHHWDQAVHLAEEYKFAEIENLLTKYATHLLSRNQFYQAVELYRKANKHIEGSKLLNDLAQKVGTQKVNPLKAKKLFILSARERLRTQTDTKYTEASGPASLSTSPWHGAEAYHLWLLAHRQLYSQQIDAAFRTALHLSQYDDVMDPKDIFSLIALISFYKKYYGQCSRAFINLETLDSLSEEEKSAYKKLALTIFATQPPVDPETEDGVSTLKCSNPKKTCSSQVKDWQASCPDCNYHYPSCLISGRSIIQPTDLEQAWTCTVCKHHILKSQASLLQAHPGPISSVEEKTSSSSSGSSSESSTGIIKAAPLLPTSLSNCPLCHAAIPAASLR